MEEKITAWAARDEDGAIRLYNKKPIKRLCWWAHPKLGLENSNILHEESLSEVKWEDAEPTKVELTIKICK